MSHTLVEWRDGSASFARSTADELTEGVLTVSGLDDGQLRRLFPAGTWAAATVYGDDGHPLFWITAEAGRRSAMRGDEHAEG